MLNIRKAWKIKRCHETDGIIAVQIPVTYRCNLSCSYCDVKKSPEEPAKEKIIEWIGNAGSLDAAMIVFLGGEPLLREDLADFIRQADKNAIVSYVTTNAKLLADEKIAELGKSGLDILEISVDSLIPNPCSEKIYDQSLIEKLESARKEYGMLFKMHQVLAAPVLDETPKLLEIAEQRNIPISFGLLNHLNYQETEKIKQTLKFLIERKQSSQVILNPLQYFVDGLKILDSEPSGWKCVVGEHYLNLSAEGSHDYCSVLDAGYPQEKNCRCMSACAYSVAYYRKNPLELLSSLINSNK